QGHDVERVVLSDLALHQRLSFELLAQVEFHDGITGGKVVALENVGGDDLGGDDLPHLFLDLDDVAGTDLPKNVLVQGAGGPGDHPSHPQLPEHGHRHDADLDVVPDGDHGDVHVGDLYRAK